MFCLKDVPHSILACAVQGSQVAGDMMDHNLRLCEDAAIVGRWYRPTWNNRLIHYKASYLINTFQLRPESAIKFTLICLSVCLSIHLVCKYWERWGGREISDIPETHSNSFLAISPAFCVCDHLALLVHTEKKTWHNWKSFCGFSTIYGMSSLCRFQSRCLSLLQHRSYPAAF